MSELDKLPLPVFYNYTKDAGRTHAYIDCPCCGESVKVFMWSFHACGKRCPKCNAHIHLSGVYPDIKIQKIRNVQESKT